MPEATDEVPAANQAIATFAGGCFWCMEKPFDELEGVLSTTSGYTGGTAVDPSYYEVSAGGTGHVEAVQVVYDSTKVSYDKLLEVFWRNVDPVDDRGQFCDQGSQYQAKIFAHTDEQRQLAEQARQALSAQAKFQQQPIVTAIEPAQTFYPAEDYHQDYYLKHPLRYKVYRTGCGRDRRLAEVWGEAAAHP
ncbi:peptide-methionine (S)-S-oxide reductase MsrA [Nodosilinea sp. LEGE 07088]|uniref:peptide-methionine (S)-S-oxide reductase MsrA n=1 Tax=Nodosilinea sp. LEGE 07088 TaxID=2777968 RepID=UPI0024140C6D